MSNLVRVEVTNFPDNDGCLIVVIAVLLLLQCCDMSHDINQIKQLLRDHEAVPGPVVAGGE